MEESRLPLHKWVHVFGRVVASKKGVSAKQIERELAVHYQTALFCSIASGEPCRSMTTCFSVVKA